LLTICTNWFRSHDPTSNKIMGVWAECTPTFWASSPERVILCTRFWTGSLTPENGWRLCLPYMTYDENSYRYRLYKFEIFAFFPLYTLAHPPSIVKQIIFDFLPVLENFVLVNTKLQRIFFRCLWKHFIIKKRISNYIFTPTQNLPYSNSHTPKKFWQ